MLLRIPSCFVEPKPYPTLDAIQNVFALALTHDPEIQNFNPLALLDLHYMREIDDSGYINQLYGSALVADDAFKYIKPISVNG